MATHAKDGVVYLSKQVEKDFSDLDSTTAQRFLANLELAAWGVELEMSSQHLGGTVGPKAIELRRNGRPAKRCVFVVERPGKVVILHAFKKTCKGVDKKNMETAKARYKQWLESRPVAD